MTRLHHPTHFAQNHTIMAASEALVLPSLDELGAPPVATAAEVVAAAAEHVKQRYPCLGLGSYGMHSFLNKKRLPINWKAIVRMAAQQHYTVTEDDDYLHLKPKDGAVEPDADLVLPPVVRRILSDVDVINSIALFLKNEVEEMVEGTPIAWEYQYHSSRRWPSWEHVCDLVKRAAAQHWVCEFDDEEQRIMFRDREGVDAGLYSQK